MSYFYPQACLKLSILLEDFKLSSDATVQKPYPLQVVARDVTVNINDHKTSDSFSAEIDFKAFPFDPRSIRACGVTVYMQDMKALLKVDGTPNTIVPSDANAVFAGFVDDESISFDDTRRTVHFEGRDFTALLIDQKYKENVPISMNRTLDVIINAFLQTFPATKKIKLINKTGGTLPTLAQFYPDFGSALAGNRNPGSHESYWEIIQDLAQRAGLICFMHLDQLILTTPRNLYNPNADVKFIYGQNVKSLTFKRKLGRLKNFNVLVRSRSGKNVVTAKIPEEATPTWCQSFGIDRLPAQVPVLKPDGSIDTSQTHIAPYIAFPIPNIANKDRLILIGQSVYEDYSRQQLEGTFETLEMLAHTGIDKQDPNYTEISLANQLDIGQPLAIEIATDDLDAISRIKDVAARVNYLIRRNYDSDVAFVFAKTLGKFSPRFYTKAFSLSVNQDSGFKLRVEFINIIELSNRNL
jgi:hypothetical protein